MNLSEIIKLESCQVDLAAKHKEEALRNISALLMRSITEANIDEEVLYQGFLQREELGSTGFSNGIAMPHCQIEGIENFYISLAVCPKGVNFDSIDHKKSRFFVSIVGPGGKRNKHLQILAACSRILREPGVLNKLLEAKSRINLYEEFLTHSDHEPQSSLAGKDKLLLLFVLDEDAMDGVTEVFVEYGIQESVILEASSMASLVSKVPLYMGLFNFTSDKSFSAKIVLAKIMTDHINAITKGLEDIFGDLDHYAGLNLVVIDLLYAKGF